MSAEELPWMNRPVGRSSYAMVAAFAVSCFVLTFFSDLAYWRTDSFLWETISVWLLAVGLLGFALAIAAGLIDIVRSRNVRGLGQPWLRVAGQFTAFALSIVNAFVHSRDGYTAVVPQGIGLSAIVVLVLLVTTVFSRPAPRRRPIESVA